MVGLAAFGAMNAMLSSGGADRGRAHGRAGTASSGLTPLPVAAYFRAKVLTGYMMAGLDPIARSTSPASRSASGSPPTSGLTMTGADPRRPDPVRSARDPPRPPAHARIRSGPRWAASIAALRRPRRRLVPDHERRALRHRSRAAVVLARAGEPRGDRRRRMGEDRLAGRGGLDCRHSALWPPGPIAAIPRASRREARARAARRPALPAQGRRAPRTLRGNAAARTPRRGRAPSSRRCRP